MSGTMVMYDVILGIRNTYMIGYFISHLLPLLARLKFYFIVVFLKK
jgi:hypothetical protein